MNFVHGERADYLADDGVQLLCKVNDELTYVTTHVNIVGARLVLDTRIYHRSRSWNDFVIVFV